MCSHPVLQSNEKFTGSTSKQTKMPRFTLGCGSPSGKWRFRLGSRSIKAEYSTPPKFNSSPLKNGWLENDPFLLGFGNFLGENSLLNFRWVIPCGHCSFHQGNPSYPPQEIAGLIIRVYENHWFPPKKGRLINPLLLGETVTLGAVDRVVDSLPGNPTTHHIHRQGCHVQPGSWNVEMAELFFGGGQSFFYEKTTMEKQLDNLIQHAMLIYKYKYIYIYPAFILRKCAEFICGAKVEASLCLKTGDWSGEVSTQQTRKEM